MGAEIMTSEVIIRVPLTVTLPIFETLMPKRG